MGELIKEFPRHAAVIGTVVEDTHTIRRQCGQQYRELLPGQAMVIVPRIVMLEALRAALDYQMSLTQAAAIAKPQP